MQDGTQRYFHLHLVSDATGETLNTVAKAAVAQYSNFRPIAHIYALVRTPSQLNRALREIEEQPGIVLFTLVNPDMRRHLEEQCGTMGVPCLSILDPIIAILSQYLNASSRPQVGGQHALNSDYFRRIDALNFTMAHDDGQSVNDLEKADVVILGVSRTSKTPTSIYLAQRGIRTANIPIVPGIPVPKKLIGLQGPLVVGLIASAERIAQIRRHRLLSLKESRSTDYIDPRQITDELMLMKTLCSKNDWPMIDVTRRSVEETAATILNMQSETRRIDK
ncbi:pyruvate, water dikinase regulatory protein [Aestuariivirga sp.]|uniref:pyruvate, water dikinase regulatory protein n=1 Tax=Aestuariivirga sp. TaxID=2650926 RepID=UPI0025C12E07|nr:pyruvate, water dikinase regulatory protein [Aestuariivirga sp.]MCA3554314.1 kinase/pyrophosphorylase [Aestuariivirga sp.]